MTVLKVTDAMTGPVWVIRPEDDLAHARKEMIRRSVKQLPVIDDGGAVVGMLSMWDIAFAPDTNLARERGMSVNLERPVSEAMTRNVFALDPEEGVHRAIRSVLSEAVQSAPVVRGGALEGIVTQTDLLQAALRGDFLPALTVADVMTPEVHSVHRHTSIPQLLETLREHRVHQVPVEEAADVLVGMATLSNIVFGSVFDQMLPIGKRLTTVHKTEHAGRKGARHVERVHAVVEDVMTAGIATVTPDQGIKAAANILIREGWNAIPVLEGDVPVGMVTRKDLLRATSEQPDPGAIRGGHTVEQQPPHTKGASDLRHRS